MKIKEYIVVEKCEPKFLEVVVDEYIQQGYQPYGSINVTNFDVDNFIYNQVMVMYDESTGWTQPYSISSTNKERKLIDFSVNWYPTLESMHRNEREFHDEGWETFKRDSVDHNTGLMTHKLMMVKYE